MVFARLVAKNGQRYEVRRLDACRSAAMTPDRVAEILQLGNAAGEYRKHMTPEEVELVYDIWARMERSASFYEVLRLIAAGERNFRG